MKIEIEGFSHISALYRALIEAKFNDNPTDTDVPGSALVADLANQVADALEKHETTNPVASLSDAGEWRNPSNHPGKIEFVRRRLIECGHWPDWTTDEKQDYIRILLSPLREESSLCQELLEFGDRLHQTS